jgi:hypothetical protein
VKQHTCSSWTRSIDRAYRHTSGNKTALAPGTWRGWASKLDWVARAAAPDGYADQGEREAIVEARADTARVMHEAPRELMELGTRRLIYLHTHEPSKITPPAIVRAAEAAPGLLRDSRTRGSGPRVLPEGVGEAVEAIIDEYARRALAGDHEAARVVLMAAQRKAEAEGTESPAVARGRRRGTPAHDVRRRLTG